MAEETDISKSLVKRAKSARRSAWFSVMLIVTTVFTMIYFFYVGGSSLSLYPEFENIKASINKSNELIERNQRPDDRLAAEIVADLEKMKLELELKQSELDLKRTELEQSSADSRRLASSITESVTKVGAVLIALYMVQILLSLTRYHFRLADHLAIVAESIQHAESDIDKLKEVMGVININHIDFGKSPTTPAANIVNLIKELPDKIATNKRVN